MLRIGAFSLGALLAVGAQGQTSEKIVIDGSTGGMPLAAALAKAFQVGNPGVTVEIGKGLGTKARIQALADGRIDIALASHGLNIGEITSQGLVVHEIANVAVVFGVNATVAVGGLTDQSICDVYAGRTANWKSLGGPELAIAALARPDSEVDTEVVRDKIACLKDLKMPEAVRIMPKSGDMAKELSATDGAIGMTTMTIVEQSQGKIKALSLNGIEPSTQNVERKTYSLVREAFFVMRSPASPTVARFLEFTRGSMGHSAIGANGAIPVK